MSADSPLEISRPSAAFVRVGGRGVYRGVDPASMITYGQLTTGSPEWPCTGGRRTAHRAVIAGSCLDDRADGPAGFCWVLVQDSIYLCTAWRVQGELPG
jgi:hypothetical protein